MGVSHTAKKMQIPRAECCPLAPSFPIALIAFSGGGIRAISSIDQSHDKKPALNRGRLGRGHAWQNKSTVKHGTHQGTHFYVCTYILGK